MREFRYCKSKIKLCIHGEKANGANYFSVEFEISGFFIIFSLVKLCRICERCLGRIAVFHAKTVEDLARIRRLKDIDGTSRGMTVNIESEKTFDETEIVDCIRLRELSIEFVNLFNGICENKEVVNVNCDNCNLVSFLKNKDGFICIRLLVTNICKGVFDIVGPKKSRLLETV